MKIENIYHNPNHIFTTTSEECPLFVRGNMSVKFEENKILISTLEKGPSHIAFGGCGGYVVRLGLQPGETYTVSLTIHLDSVLRGNILGNALKLCFGYFDMADKKHEQYSEAAPNEVGVWDLHLTFSVPIEVKGCWVTFIVGTQVSTDVVSVSDIRITNTKKTVAPFGKSPLIKLPYHDVVNDRECVREYMDSIKLTVSEYIKYLQYARENGYEFDIEQVRKVAVQDNFYKFITQLFIDDTVENYTDLLYVINNVDNDVKSQIAEKLILLKKYELVEELLKNKVIDINNFVMFLVQMNLWTRKGKWNEAKDSFHSACSNKQDLVIDSYSFLDDELYDIIQPISQNMIVQRYNSLKWILKNYSEIKRRAKLMSYSKTISAEKKPVWVYWAQGIDSAPEIVKLCIESMKSVFGDRLHVLTDNNIHYYVSSYYAERISSFAHKSDYIRAELLYRYGGTWIDSTCMVKPELKQIVDNNDFVVACYPPARTQMGNWFLSINERYSWLFSLMYAALTMWITERGDFNEYFMFHAFWRILVTIDPQARKCWDSVYQINASKARSFLLYRIDELFNVLDEEEYKNIYDGAPLLKLTYKYEQYGKDSIKLNSNISRLIRGEDLL